MAEISDDGLAITLPDGWRCVHEGDPYSIVRLDRTAYITFGTAFGMGNSSPDFLLQFDLKWGRSNDLGEPFDIATGTGPPAWGAASYRKGGDVARRWQISDGKNFCSALFISYETAYPASLAGCDEIIRSIRLNAEEGAIDVPKDAAAAEIVQKLAEGG